MYIPIIYFILFFSIDGYRNKPTYGRHAANKHNDSMSDVSI